jgi:MFS family permease
MSDQAAVSPSGQPLKWYQGLERYCWVVLIIAALGWLFDTMDQNLFNLVRVPSLKEILHPYPDDLGKELSPEEKQKLDADVKKIGPIITAIFIVGWATGGWLFGIMGDRLGRTKTMMITILVYAVFTGASGLVGMWGIPRSWELYAAMRFLTGLGVGGEYAAGASLVAEVFPARSRTMALGLLQALSSVGNMMAALITLSLASIIPEEDQATSWRWAYFIGFIPALLCLWIRRSVREPEGHGKSANPGRIADLFTHPVLRRNTISAVLMATAGVGALWGVGFFSTDMIRGKLNAQAEAVRKRHPEKAEQAAKLKEAGLDEKGIGKKTSIMFLLQNAGSFFGIYLFAVFAEKVGRKKAFLISFVLAWASVLLFFWGVSRAGENAYSTALALAMVMGFCTLGPFSGYTIHFPYLFPMRLRATGMGFCYNVARYLAAFAPFMLGGLSNSMGGLAPAATVISCVYVLGFIGLAFSPETKGKPLPEDKDFEAKPA